MSDRVLVERTLSGDKTAFEELYDQYAKLIRAICFDSTGELATAQDLSQEVFFRAYQRLHTLRDRDNFVHWLRGIAKVTCREWKRKQFRDKHEFGEISGRIEPATPPNGEDDRFASIHQAMKRLSERERLALHAFYLSGQSAADTRKILNLSQSGFYKLLGQARDKLRKRIHTEEGAT